MTPDRCTCTPGWVYEPGCGTPHRETGMCSWCEDAGERDLLEQHQDGECPSLEEIEELA